MSIDPIPWFNTCRQSFHTTLKSITPLVTKQAPSQVCHQSIYAWCSQVPISGYKINARGLSCYKGSYYKIWDTSERKEGSQGGRSGGRASLRQRRLRKGDILRVLAPVHQPLLPSELSIMRGIGLEEEFDNV